MRRKPEHDQALEALFDSGVALDRAWIKFSQGLDHFAWRALQTAPENDDLLREEDPQRYEQLSRGWLPRTFDLRVKKLGYRTRDERAYLLDRIYRGELWAIGFRTLSDGSDELARVPREHFFVDFEREDPLPEIDWSKGALRAGDSCYFDIHVAEQPQGARPSPIASSSTDNQNLSQRLSTRRRGRPKTKDKIEATVRVLIESNAGFLALPNRQAQAEEVRARIVGEEARHDHERIGYSTSSIVKILGQVIGN